jgi:hypothetical protein
VSTKKKLFRNWQHNPQAGLPDFEGLAMEYIGIFFYHLVYFTVIWYILWSFGTYILWSFGIFYGHLVHIFYGNLVYFMVIWYIYFMVIWYILWSFGTYIFPVFGMFDQEKSGNPVHMLSNIRNGHSSKK